MKKSVVDLQGVVKGFLRPEYFGSWENFLKTRPWEALEGCRTAVEWDLCISTITSSPLEIGRLHNENWYEDSMAILQARPTGESTRRLVEWLLVGSTRRFTWVERVELFYRLFEIRVSEDESLATFHWPVINRFIKQHPDFYWVHPQIRQIFLDRILDATSSGTPSHPREISKTQVDELEQAIRRIVEAEDTSMRVVLENLRAKLRFGGAIVDNRDDDFAPCMFSALVEEACDSLSKMAQDRSQFGIEHAICRFLQTHGVQNCDMGGEIKTSTDGSYELKYTFRVDPVHLEHEHPDLSRFSMQLEHDGFSDVVIDEAIEKYHVNCVGAKPIHRLGSGNRTVGIRATPRQLEKDGRTFYGGRLKFTLVYQPKKGKAEEFKWSHYHCGDERQDLKPASGDIRVAEKIRISLPPKQPRHVYQV